MQALALELAEAAGELAREPENDDLLQRVLALSRSIEALSGSDGSPYMMDLTLLPGFSKEFADLTGMRTQPLSLDRIAYIPRFSRVFIAPTANTQRPGVAFRTFAAVVKAEQLLRERQAKITVVMVMLNRTPPVNYETQYKDMPVITLVSKPVMGKPKANLRPEDNPQLTAFNEQQVLALTECQICAQAPAEYRVLPHNVRLCAGCAPPK